MLLGNHFLNGFVGCIYSLDISNRYVGLPDADGGEENNDNSNMKTWHGSLKEILQVTRFILFCLQLDSFIQYFYQSIDFYIIVTKRVWIMNIRK